MRKPEWSDVLGPRAAVIAGMVGFAIVWPLGYYVSNAGYVFWGFTPPQYRNLVTVIDVLSFTLPYLLVKWWRKRR